MACYLFTFHTYGSWMPDRPEGYVARGQGIQKTNHHLAQIYRDRATHDTIMLNPAQQDIIINELRVASQRQDWRLHAAVATPTHVHLIVSWREYRPWDQVHAAIKQSLTRRLNREAGKRPWFGRGGSRKRVTDRKHFDHLASTYLPRHRGRYWRER